MSTIHDLEAVIHVAEVYYNVMCPSERREGISCIKYILA
jgi:hypothetical protein